MIDTRQAPSRKPRMPNNPGQSGGIFNSGTMNSGGGDIVGGNKTVSEVRTAAIDEALHPLIDAVETAHGETRRKAETKLAALKDETGKGNDASDESVADLLDGIVDLVPGAANAAVSAFASPVLGSIVGPVTKFVLRKLRGK